MKKLQQQSDLHLYLRKIFNYEYFKEGQQEIIEDVLKGKDVLGILPTGSGKSLCYQLPAKIVSGITIVVSPLISLMVDQVRQTKAFHFKEVVALHSFQNRRERKVVLQHINRYKLVYVSPELLQQQEVLQVLSNIKVSLFVIDEAHCISQWGYDFRPDYLRLSNVIKKLNNPTILALTGTATPEVQQDIIDKLDRKEMKKHVYPMDRKNISLLVQQIEGNEEEKVHILTQLLETYHVPTIIYFSSRNITEQIAQQLSAKLTQRKVAYYHGGMETLDRLKVQQQFMTDQLDIICCTSAFGMGINKKNIRFVIHYHLPTQLESYIQEIGRAGRDGEESISLLLYRSSDFHIPLQIIENELPTDSELMYVLNQLAQLYVKNREIPKDETTIVQLFQITITKWRFLHYQFETHGMISNNKIQYDITLWKQAFHIIQKFSQERLAMKRMKLTEMMDWSSTTNCLRKQLYRSFQKNIQEKDQQCCSNCGFSFADWQYEKTVKNSLASSDWKSQLASILLIGENDETSRIN